MSAVNPALASPDAGLVEASVLPYSRAHKTKPILVKPMSTLLNDPRVTSKFMLATLEGSQMLRANSMVCMGEAGDVWQQDCIKLHKQYTPTAVDADGWTTFVPKPEAEREVCEITIEGCATGEGTFTIKAHWGDRQPDGTFLQTGHSGDVIARDASPDHGAKGGLEDSWVIRRKVYDATYASIGDLSTVELKEPSTFVHLSELTSR